MPPLPKKEVSLWVESTKRTKYSALKENIKVDTAVIGGGVAGLTLAYLLCASGKKVAVLEKSGIGLGVTGHTTGKVSSQHSLCYADLAQRLGEADARIYGEANQTALEKINEIITTEKIVCDWTREDNYVFTEKASQMKKFKEEAKTAKKLGLPASFEKDTPLPFPIKAAVRFSNQAKIHAGNYLQGLAKAITEKDGLVFEETEAKDINDGEPARVRTDRAEVIASDIVIATNVPYPWLAHGYYCAYEYPLKSYIIACRFQDDMKGMFITPGRAPQSLLPVTAGKNRYLLVGGRSHVPGLNAGSGNRFKALADYAAVNIGIESIEYKWSARDYLGYDDKPLAGRLYPWSKHVFSATGFMKWGLTNATACAMILHDLLSGEDNPWAKTFDPHRFTNIKSIPRAAAKYFS
ncbi:MAG TPA: FAD-binding oxidoreductase [Candidatus Saccharimonadales bacterium]|nr:FAD-binding oxidoreductase [Candidatus Saccharimonadales bacterium]